MTSVETSIKQSGGYYVPLGDIRAQIVAYRTDLAAFSTAAWATYPPSGAGTYSTLVASAGAAILKDMGKTIVSSTRTFRKIQLVVPLAGAKSTFGVAGDVTTATDYLTGYIELGLDGSGTPAKVAQFGR